MNATTGIVLVAAVTALTTGLVPATIKSGLRNNDLPHLIRTPLMMSFSGIAFDDYIFPST